MLVQVEDADDARMVEPAGDGQLAAEALGDERAFSEVRVEDLDRHLGAARPIAGGEDFGQAA